MYVLLKLNQAIDMKVITVANLKKKIIKHFEDVSKSDEMIFVPVNDEEDAIVIMSIGEYNSLTETAYLCSTEANRNRLRESIAQLGGGKLIQYNENANEVDHK